MSLEDFRAAAEAVAERAKNDPDYQNALLNDPISVLAAAGLPLDFAQKLVDSEDESDVTGYSMETGCSCNDTTCWTSGCPATCNVSMCGSSYNN